ncbi:MAG: restriction endonuclease [Ramlibacter sp.]
MRASLGRWVGQDPARQMMGMAAPFLILGAALMLLSMVLGASSSPSLQSASQGARAPAPYLLAAGFILLAVALVLRLRNGPRKPPRPDTSQLSSHLGNTTLFGSQLDSAMGDLVAVPAGRPLRPPAQMWNTQVFRDIEWRRFELVCAALFAQAGFEARTESHGPDGGGDIWLYSGHMEGPAALVRCKHRPGKKVALAEVREFHQLMRAHQVLRGTFANSGTFTAEAREFSKANGINAMDRLGLLALISQRTMQQKEDLLQLAYQDEYWRPTCARCGTRMVERRARKRGRTFWGCVDYPQCDFMLPVSKA